jgi:hypothetical protein
MYENRRVYTLSMYVYVTYYILQLTNVLSHFRVCKRAIIIGRKHM